MKYSKIQKGVFLKRPNRFIAHVLIDGKEEVVHVKNTGRCRELLVEGVELWLEDFTEAGGTRKTKYDVIGVNKRVEDGHLLINMDSQAPNKVAEEALVSGVFQMPGFCGLPTLVKREVTYGKSRFDLYMEGSDELDSTKIKKAFIEVKGCTLEKNGVVMFPDAPTERGVKHILELIEAKKAGYEAAILIVIQMERAEYFCPNDETHPEFGEALRLAQREGVHVLAYNCKVTPDTLELDRPVPVKL